MKKKKGEPETVAGKFVS